MFYVEMPDEVMTLGMIERALKEEKRLCAPRILLTEHRMILIEAQLKNGKVLLRRGAYGIYEPAGEKIIYPEDIDFVVAPGRAFDRSGRRLGRGMGYYDDFLKQLNSVVPLCALAFDCQLLEEVPTDENDFPIDALITESNIYEF